MQIAKKFQKSGQFLVRKLNAFVREFKSAYVRLQLDEFACVYTIEVTPNELYRFNPEYLRWESDFMDLFIKNFPDQNVCIISDDAVCGIKGHYRAFVGICYNLPISIEKRTTILIEPTINSYETGIFIGSVETSYQKEYGSILLKEQRWSGQEFEMPVEINKMFEKYKIVIADKIMNAA